MNKRDELIVKYVADIKDKFGINPDIDLLTKVTIGCGPAIYNPDSSTVSSSDESELETVKQNFLLNKLGLNESDDLMSGIKKIMDDYGKTNRSKYRAVVYYMLTKHFNMESHY